jgi:hypothetical protein
LWPEREVAEFVPSRRWKISTVNQYSSIAMQIIDLPFDLTGLAAGGERVSASRSAASRFRRRSAK